MATPTCNKNPPRAESTSSCHRVFAITELAESIFLQLRAEHILPIQRVCRQWHTLISTSDPIQEHLFFKPIAAPHNTAERSSNSPQPGKPYPLCAPPKTTRLENPFYHLLTQPLPHQAHSSNASWRHMLLTQPPLSEIHLCTKEDWSDTTSLKKVSGSWIRLCDLASYGVIYGVGGSADWESYGGYEQMRKLKKVKALVMEEEDVEIDDEDEAEWMEDMRW